MAILKIKNAQGQVQSIAAIKGEKGIGIPDGGTAGQVLKKTATGTEWGNIASGGETWELIKSCTTSEALTSITIDKDSNEQNISLKSFKLVLYNYSGSSFNVSTYFAIKLNTFSWMEQLCTNLIGTLNNNASLSFSFNKLNDTTHEVICDTKFHYRIDGEKGIHNGTYSHIDSVSSITVCLGTGGNIPSGMKLILFGVRE